MSSTTLKARRTTNTKTHNNKYNNSSVSDTSDDSKRSIKQISTTPSKAMKVKVENKKKSSFRCTPVKILLCFLCGWVSAKKHQKLNYQAVSKSIDSV